MSAPDGTRPWRKAWRKRWREGSSFRQLSPLAKLLVVWVEDNADDDGRVTTTIRYLTAMLGCQDIRVSASRGAIWRALQEAKKAGVLQTRSEQEAGGDAGKAPTTITRVNFRQYQESPEEKRAEKRADLETGSGLSSRSKQKNAEKQMGAADAAAPGWQDLIAGLNGCWTATYQGEKYVWQPRDFKALKTLRASLPDAEILRRFGNYLANRDPFYAGHPVGLFCSQVNRFVAGAVPDVRIGSVPAESHEEFRKRGGGVVPW